MEDGAVLSVSNKISAANLEQDKRVDLNWLQMLHTKHELMRAALQRYAEMGPNQDDDLGNYWDAAEECLATHEEEEEEEMMDLFGDIVFSDGDY